MGSWAYGFSFCRYVGHLHIFQFGNCEDSSTDIKSGPDSGDSIRSILQTATDVYAAVGNKVIKYFRGKEVGRLEGPDDSILGTMILLGDDLMALKEDGTGLLIWNTKSGGKSLLPPTMIVLGVLSNLRCRIAESDHLPQGFHRYDTGSPIDLPEQGRYR